MNVVIAGAHGQIALRLSRLLADRGDTVTGLHRNPDHAEEVRAAGAQPMACDLEKIGVAGLASMLAGADAVVFAAGAGPGSSAERKLTVDRDGAILLLNAARAAGVHRYVMVSAVGAEDPPAGDEVFAVYLQAKAAADAAVAASDREWTIVRPGRLTDDPATGEVRIDSAPFRGEVTRDDVATVLAAVLHEPLLARSTFYLNGGGDTVGEALAALLNEHAPSY